MFIVVIIIVDIVIVTAASRLGLGDDLGHHGAHDADPHAVGDLDH
jgi:hypothetical protein